MIPSVVSGKTVDMLEPVSYPSTEFCQVPYCFATPTTNFDHKRGCGRQKGHDQTISGHTSNLSQFSDS